MANLHEQTNEAQQEPMALETVYETIIQWDEGGGKRSRRELARRIVALYTRPQAREPQWIDPNDKTQKQYLPHIGEPVLFCHDGKTYTGNHTGGSFQSEVTNEYFNTWECRWMYLPAAHGITGEKK